MLYLADKNHGIVKEKAVAGVLMQVKYLPIEYLAYKDFSDKNLPHKLEKQELLESYKNTLSFMLTLGPDKDEKFDITRVGVSNYEEFAERVEVMNFQMGNFITLEYEGKKITPKLTLMENSYGLANQRVIVVSFEVENNLSNEFMKKRDCKFIFDDGLFFTGQNKFAFKKDEIAQLPEFEF